MPVFRGKGSKMSYKKAYATRRARTSVNSRVASAIRSMTGAGLRRQLVSVPAAMRARGNMATELKTCDYSNASEITGTPINIFKAAGGATASVLLNMPIEGSSFYNRIARRTRGVALNIMGFIKPTLANAAAKPSQYARIMVIYDRQPNGAVPSLATILLDYDQGGTTTTQALSGINPDQRDRFMVLRDRKILLPPLGINGVAPTLQSVGTGGVNSDLKDSLLVWNEYIKLNGLETQYKASTGGGIGDIASGSYLVVAIDSEDTSTSAWSLQWKVRYSFYD